MRRAGGEADKVGNRYEILWTVKCLLAILEDKADRIHLEPSGPEGNGIEFLLIKGDLVEHHQAKQGSSWTLTRLGTEGVLSHLQRKLRDPNARFVYVSDGKAESLEDLTRRAQDMDKDLMTYLQHNMNQELSGQFALLCKLCGEWSEEETFHALKRVDVKHWPEKALRQHVEDNLALLVDARPQTAYSVLENLILDSVDTRKILTAHDVWQHLEQNGIRPNQWYKDPSRVALINDVTKRYMGRLHGESICGKIIPRPEAEVLLGKLGTPELKRAFLVTGDAGGGKSGLLLQVVESVRSNGWPVLAFRLDNLKPANTPDEIGYQLTGQSRSPAHMLAAIAQAKDCLLVIDQLDAVSFTYGRDTQLWYPIEEIIAQALNYGNMRVLLACRRFDVENDHRLRQLTMKSGVAEPFGLGLLKPESVCQVMRSVGLDTDQLTDKQITLLSTPLHLKLLVDSIENGTSGTPAFANETDLYNLFWDHKQMVVSNLLGSSRWTDAIDAITDYMSEHQSTSVPVDALDHVSNEWKAMASEHVLVEDANMVSFFHDGFFDYAFARRFSARGGKVLDLLLSAEQHLFRRSQVRQVLTYQRNRHKGRYLESLAELLFSPIVRFHIKSVVFDYLANLSDPPEEEWAILAKFLESKTHSAVTNVWRVLQGKPPWFELLDSLGVWQRWLAGDDEDMIGRVVWLLWTVQELRADRVAELVEPYVDASAAWSDRLLYLISYGSLSAGRRFFELFLQLIDIGMLDDHDEAQNREFWHLIYHLLDDKPEWACEAIGHYLRRRLKLNQDTGCPNPFSETIKNRSQVDDRLFEACAQKAPAQLLDEILPFIIEVVELTALREGATPWRDSVWEFRSKGRQYSVDDHILEAAETALRALATSPSAEPLVNYIQRLKGTPYETLDFLLMGVYSANPEVYADEAIDYLCDCPRRLDIDWSNTDRTVGAELLAAVTPHCSQESLTKLEDTLLSHFPDWERKARERFYWGRSQHALLESCDYERLSDKAKRRLAEWRRKFPDRRFREAPLGDMASFVGSPIPLDAASKMTDDQWLEAMKRYTDERDFGERDGHLVGGAMQLSRVLGEQVKTDPLRYAALALKMPDDTQVGYFDAILMAIAETNLPVEEILAVCQRCHSLPSRPCGRWIHRPISRRTNHPLPDEAMDIVAWYAIEDNNPMTDRWPNKEGSRRHSSFDDIINEGINTVRGSAAYAMADIIFGDPQRVVYLLPTLRRMVGDPCTSVRSCVAKALLPVLNYDRDLALELFIDLCDDADEALLGTGYVEHFIQYAIYTHFGRISPLLDRMLVSENADVAEVGGRLACLSSLMIAEARPRLTECLAQGPNARKGAAEILAEGIQRNDIQAVCEEALVNLFHDADQKVRQTAAACIGGLNADEIGLHVGLIKSLINSSAFEDGVSYLIDKLHESTDRLPDLTCDVCERYLRMAGADIADITTARAAHTDRLVELVIRNYSHTSDSVIQKRCLDMMDQILLTGATEPRKFLDMFDR